MPSPCAFGCRQSDVPMSMHRFPDPNKFPERFKTWVALAGGKLETPEDYKLFEKKRVCNKHFKDGDHNRNNRLNALAIPSLFLAGVTIHKFPNPSKDPERFKSWVQSAAQILRGVSNETIYSKKNVCDKHFPEHMKNRNNRVNNLAIPTLHLSRNNLGETDIFKVPNAVARKTTKKDGDGVDDLGEGRKDDEDKVELFIDKPLLKYNKTPKEVDVPDDAADDADPLLIPDDASSVAEDDKKDFKVCIGCLNVAGDLREFDGRLREAFSSVTNLEIDSEDMPNSICVICIARLSKAVAFKSQCTRAYNALTRAVYDSDQGWQSAVLSIKREELKLNLNLCLSQMLYEDIQPVDDHVEPDDFDCVDQENAVTTLNDSLEYDDNVGESGFSNSDHNKDDAMEKNDSKPVLPEDLDMTDIFKDLKDESASELESLCDVKVEPEIKAGVKKIIKMPSVYIGRKKYKKLANVTCGHRWLKMASLSLSTAHIRYLSVSEQRRGHLARLSRPSFVKALYKCAPCVKTFKDRAGLIEHVGFHQRMKEFRFPCNICKCCFETLLELDRHSMMQHWYEFEHKQCTKKHRELTSLITCYEKNKDNPSTVVAPSDDLQHFVRHRLSDAERLQPVRNPMLKSTCPLCPKSFNENLRMLEHLRLHQPDERRNVKCDVCGIYLATKRSLDMHHSLNHIYLYKCRHCNVDCSNSSQASAHFKQFHKTEVKTVKKKFTCKTCKAQFDVIGEYKSHVRLHLSHCNMCGHVAGSLQALYYHQLSQHAHVRLGVAELNDVSVYCAECSLYFVDKEAYWTHCGNHHKRLPDDCDTGCNVCYEVYSTPDELKEHNCVPKDEHEDNDEREYEPPSKCRKMLCADCGMTYTNYATHVTVHHNPLGKCKFCNQRSVNAKFMTSHILATHTFKPYMCTVCDMRFFQRTNCRDHILKTHTPETPFKCKWCARKFALMDYLNKHLKNEHKNRVGQEDAEMMPQRELGKLYTFPHMRIDVTLVPSELVKQVTFYISNYAETKYTELGDGEKDQYLYVDRNIDPNVPCDNIVRNKKLLRRKRRLLLSNAAKYRRAAELAVESISQPTEGDEGVNPALATLDVTENVYADAAKEAITRPIKTVKFEPAGPYAGTKMKVDVQCEPVDEKMQHVGGEVKHVGGEVKHVGEVAHVGEVTHVGGEVAHVGGEVEVAHVGEVAHVVGEVAHVGSEVMNVDEENVVGQLVNHNGRTYVLVDGALYELEN